MSFSSSSEEWPEAVRQFVYNGNPRELSRLVLNTCLVPSLKAAQASSGGEDLAIGRGLGGEITRFTYWQGTLGSLGEPPLDFNVAKRVLTGYSVFSDLIPPREHITIALLGSVSCAYEKGFAQTFGEVG